MAVDCRIVTMLHIVGWIAAFPTFPLWIADQVRNDVVVMAGGYSAWHYPPFPSRLRIKSAMTWWR